MPRPCIFVKRIVRPFRLGSGLYPRVVLCIPPLPDLELLLPPLELVAQPPEDLAPGEYWSRVIVATREAQPTHPVTGDGAIRVWLALETRTIISVQPMRETLEDLFMRMHAASKAGTFGAGLPLVAAAIAFWDAEDGGVNGDDATWAALEENRSVEGLDLVLQRLAQGHNYCLAFVDMRMPPGWDCQYS